MVKATNNGQRSVTIKGVVRSKIWFFKNWICESRRPGRDIAFYPNKIGQKLAEIWGVQYNSLKTRFLSDFGWPEKPIYQVRHRTINQSNSSNSNVSTNRITEISSHKTQKIWASHSKLITAMFMRACKTSCHFYKGGSRFIVLIYVCTSACVRARQEYILILGRPRHWKWTWQRILWTKAMEWELVEPGLGR